MDKWDSGGVTLTLDDLIEARDLFLQETVPSECPHCFQRVTNRLNDIIFLTKFGVGCHSCQQKWFTEADNTSP